jgi:hypothetical protein
MAKSRMLAVWGTYDFKPEKLKAAIDEYLKGAQ